MSFTLSLNNIRCERDDRVLFEGLSADFQSGDLIHLVGPNGAGKTTLLKIITGLSTRYEGEVSWQPQQGSASKVSIPSDEYASHILYLGHLTGVNRSLTPLENLQWYIGLHGVKSVTPTTVGRAALLNALALVGLAGYEEFPCYQMSAGQQRRVALARLYLSEAPVWILDEPFTAIDKQGVNELEARFAVHRENGGIVVLTTHQSMHASDPVVIDLADYCG